MKSKEAIRNRIIHYANLVWGNKNINKQNALIHLLIEETCNELYLLDNKLNEIDTTILKRLVQRLSPSTFNYIRPASSIIFIKPENSNYELSKKTEFITKAVPYRLKTKGITSVSFTSVVDTVLNNLSISHIFFQDTLYSTDNVGNKKQVFKSTTKSSYNIFWFCLETADEIKDLKNLFFYLDFPHLNDDHEYYDLLSTIKWSMDGNLLSMKNGFPVLDKDNPSSTEEDTLDLYRDHYQTFADSLLLKELKKKHIPDELQSIIPFDVANSNAYGYWFCIRFPSQFSTNDLNKFIILTNAFPVLNRRYNELRQTEDEIDGIISLPSQVGEEFLEIDHIKDNNNINYTSLDTENIIGNSGYTIEPIRKKMIEDPRIYNYLERMSDIIEDEKTAFPEIDKEKITHVLNSISSIRKNEQQREGINKLNEFAEIARLQIKTQEDTIQNIQIYYWSTLAKHVNDFIDTELMADKVPELNKSNAILLTPVQGAKSFYDTESLKAINRFYLTSKNRILTKHNIISFCLLELGGYAQNIEVTRKVKISPSFSEGLINIIEIQIIPSENSNEYFKQKQVLKDLKLRLQKRSPLYFNYELLVKE